MSQRSQTFKFQVVQLLAINFEENTNLHNLAGPSVDWVSNESTETIINFFFISLSLDHCSTECLLTIKRKSIFQYYKKEKEKRRRYFPTAFSIYLFFSFLKR